MIWILIAIIVGSVGLDQLTKWLTVRNLELYESFPLWEDVLHFTYVQNEGMAFGMMDDSRWVFMTFSSVAIVALSIYLFRFRPTSKWMQVSIAMIIGGGIGNMIDRIFLGYVIDFIDFTLINFAVFNVADSFVCVGAGMLMFYLVMDIIKDAKKEKAKKPDASQTEQTDEDRVE
ncbi:MAG: signal peptidase II [Clostridia bacterium]|nr:signal peptidase II [Clostridia bacterium]